MNTTTGGGDIRAPKSPQMGQPSPAPGIRVPALRRSEETSGGALGLPFLSAKQAEGISSGGIESEQLPLLRSSKLLKFI